MVGHQVLVLSIEVRILVPQLVNKISLRGFVLQAGGKHSVGHCATRVRNCSEISF